MLTGYDEFQYIYEATSYPDVQYILKSEGYKRIIRAVDDAIENINRQTHAEKILKEAKEQLKPLSSILKRDFFVSVLKGRYEESTVNDPKIDIVLNMANPVFTMVCRCLSGEEGHFGSHEKKASDPVTFNQYLHHIGNIIGIYITSICLHEMVVEERNIYFFMQYRDGLEPPTGILKGSLEVAQEYCKNTMGASVSFAIEFTPVHWDKLWEKTNQLQMLLNMMNVSGQEMIICETGQQKGYGDQTGITQNLADIPQSKMNTLYESLYTGREKEYFSILGEIRQSIVDIKSMHSMVAQERYFSVALAIMNCINKYGLSLRLAFETSLYKLTQIDAHASWRDAFVYLEDLSEKIFKLRMETAIENEHEIVQCIKRHVMQNLKEPDKTTLLYISETLYFNPSYLSRLFKQLSGTKLSEFIISSRIEAAKTLLADPGIRVAEIARQVGYTSSANFTRIFKKRVGLSPHDFRIHQAKMQLNRE